MSLNVKDPEVYELAKAISRETGESMTTIVKEALKDKYALLKNRRGKATVKEMKEIANRFASHIKGPVIDHAELLYDEKGLPK